MEESLAAAAGRIATAQALLITAGAGMGVDSGLPDFRGSAGFWKAYPAYAAMGLQFAQLANPLWFETDPALAWGFYGHRLALYRTTIPHPGFAILQRWGQRMKHGLFVLTSNVDGQFQKAGFHANSIDEIHGSIHWMQCTQSCGIRIFPADPFQIDVDPETFRAVGTLPACPACGALARPNILMFGDDAWDASRSDEQRRGLNRWLDRLHPRDLVVVECGAGTAIPSVRRFSEHAATLYKGKIIRINPREPEVERPHISLEMNAYAALAAIDALLPPPVDAPAYSSDNLPSS